MARFRVSGPAQGDLAHILATSLERGGEAARKRYAQLMTVALRAIAESATGPATRARDELGKGLRSMHVRQARGAAAVRDPVHVIFFRVHGECIEIVRVLHERMDPARHVTTQRSTRRKR